MLIRRKGKVGEMLACRMDFKKNEILWTAEVAHYYCVISAGSFRTGNGLYMRIGQSELDIENGFLPLPAKCSRQFFWNKNRQLAVIGLSQHSMGNHYRRSVVCWKATPLPFESVLGRICSKWDFNKFSNLDNWSLVCLGILQKSCGNLRVTSTLSACDICERSGRGSSQNVNNECGIRAPFQHHPYAISAIKLAKPCNFFLQYTYHSHINCTIHFHDVP